MEERTKNVCIKVDNAKYIQDIGARPLLQVLTAMVECAIETRRYKELVLGCMMMMKSLIDDTKAYEKKQEQCGEEEDYDDTFNENERW